MACVLYFQTMTQRSGPLFPLSPRFYSSFRTVRRSCAAVRTHCGPGFTIKVKNREKKQKDKINHQFCSSSCVRQVSYKTETDSHHGGE